MELKKFLVMYNTLMSQTCLLFRLVSLVNIPTLTSVIDALNLR